MSRNTPAAPDQQPHPQRQPFQQPSPELPYPGVMVHTVPGPAIYTTTFHKQTGMLILAQTSRVEATGTWPEIRQAFWKAQTHCLVFGWWGVLSALVYNWVALVHNLTTIRRIKQNARILGEA